MVAARWLKLSAEERERTGVMAPSHELREGINAHIRERLAREGRIAGPILQTQRLVSKGYTRAEKALASNYAPGDVVAFHRPYKRLGVEKGDERRVESVDRKNMTVHLEGPDGSTVAWKPSEIGGRQRGLSRRNRRASRGRLHPLDPQRQGARAGQQRHGRGRGRAQRAGDVPAGGRAQADADARRPTVAPSRSSRMGLDRARLSGHTVNNVIAAMEADHPQLTTAKAFYVEISRARDRAELVTDDAQALKERLEAVTGERISALEGIGESVQPGREREHGKDGKALPDRERPGPEPSAPLTPEKGIRAVNIAGQDAGARAARQGQRRRDRPRPLSADRSHLASCIFAFSRTSSPCHQRRFGFRGLDDAFDAESVLFRDCRRFLV